MKPAGTSPVRAWIFCIATVLALAGFYMNFFELVLFFSEGWWQGALVLFTSICAWVAYFAIGTRWIKRMRVPYVWIISGTIAGILALNGGGIFFIEGKAYTPALMVIPVATVLPAVMMMTWIIGSELWRAAADRMRFEVR